MSTTYKSWAEAADAPENQPAEVFRARVIAGEIEIDRGETVTVENGKRVRVPVTGRPDVPWGER